MDMDTGKEKLTFAIIKKELMKTAFIKIVGVLIATPLLGLLLWMIAQLFTMTTLYPIVTKIFIIILLLSFIIESIYSTHFTFKIKNEQFIIREAVLYKKEESKGSKRDSLYYVPPRLFFDRGGYYDVRDSIYYKWSPNYSMRSSELFNTSRIDDHFTLVMLGKKILMVYNDKFFDTSSIQYSI